MMCLGKMLARDITDLHVVVQLYHALPRSFGQNIAERIAPLYRVVNNALNQWLQIDPNALDIVEGFVALELVYDLRVVNKFLVQLSE